MNGDGDDEEIVEGGGGVGGGRLSYPTADSFMCGNDATFGYGGCIYDPY
jgi:hypothetical protein